MAGPVCVGVVAIPSELYKAVLDDFVRLGVKDSKQLTASQRHDLFIALKEYSRDDLLVFTKAFVHAHVIDAIGISRALKTGINRSLRRLEVDPGRSFVYLDGALKAPEQYKQATIIKGDQKLPIISMASIVAKVTRDAFMHKMHFEYPEYGFDEHKGYGTSRHRAMIRRHGFSHLHRKTFCGNC